MVKGHNPGLYGTWFGVDGAADQVKGYSGAICKGFHAREEALEWLKQFSEETQLEFAPDLLDLIEKLPIAQEIVDAEEILQAGRVLIYTDGAAITNPGPGGRE